MNEVPDASISSKWKGMNYDSDVEDAKLAGEAEGRNARIEAKRKTFANKEVPSLHGRTSSDGANVPKGNNEVSARKPYMNFSEMAEKVKYG
jgi:hypothetical protein